MYECCIGIKKSDVTGQQQPSQQWPTTANAGRNCPLVPHIKPCTPRCHLRLMGNNPPSKRIYFLGVEGVCGPQHTPMLWRCIIAGTKDRIEGHTPPRHPQNYIQLLRRSWPINLTHQHKAQCLMWGIRWAFPPLVAMIVMVFCSVPEHEPHFPVEPQHSGYCQKALVSSKMILELYQGGDVEIKEKLRQMGNKHLSPT